MIQMIQMDVGQRFGVVTSQENDPSPSHYHGFLGIHHGFMGISYIHIAIFHSFLFVYQRVALVKLMTKC